jgi:hypothetical protein
MQADLRGRNQISDSSIAGPRPSGGKPKVFLQVQYSGGLGIAGAGKVSLFMTNSFAVGADYPFHKGGQSFFFNLYACCRLRFFQSPVMIRWLPFYWLLFNSNYKFNFSGNIVHPDREPKSQMKYMMNESGKRFFSSLATANLMKVYKG